MAILHADYHSGMAGGSDARLLSVGILPIEMHDRNNSVSRLGISFQELREALTESKGFGLFEIQIADDPETKHVVVTKMSKHPDSKRLQHITLREVGDDDRIALNVPVVVPSAHASRQVAPCVRLRGKVSDLPPFISVEESGSGQLVAGDLVLPDTVVLESPTDELILRSAE